MTNANKHGLSRERSGFSLPRWKLLEQVYAAYSQKMQNAQGDAFANTARAGAAAAGIVAQGQGEVSVGKVGNAGNAGSVGNAGNADTAGLVLTQKEWQRPQALPLCISYEARCLLEFYQPLVESNALLICDVRVGLEQIPLLIVSPHYGLVLLSLCTATVAQLRADLSILLQHERRGVRWRQDLLASLCKDLKLSLDQSLALQDCTCILLCLSSCQVTDIKQHLLPQLRNYSRPQEAARLMALFTDQLTGFRLRYLKQGAYEQVQAKLQRTYQNLSTMGGGKKANAANAANSTGNANANTAEAVATVGAASSTGMTSTTTSSLAANGQSSLPLWLALPQGSKRLPPWTPAAPQLEALPAGVYRGRLSLESPDKVADRAASTEPSTTAVAASAAATAATVNAPVAANASTSATPAAPAGAASAMPMGAATATVSATVSLFQYLRWPEVRAPRSFLSAAQVQQWQQRLLYLACTFQPLATTQIVTQSTTAPSGPVNSKANTALLSPALEQYLRTLNGFQLRAILSPQPFILLSGVYGSGRTVVLVVRALYAYMQWCLNGGVGGVGGVGGSSELAATTKAGAAKDALDATNINAMQSATDVNAATDAKDAKTAKARVVQPCVLLLYAHEMQGQRLKNCLSRQVQALALPREAFVLQKLGPYMQQLASWRASVSAGVNAGAGASAGSGASAMANVDAGAGAAAANVALPRCPVLEIDEVQELSCTELQALYDYHQPQCCLLVGDLCQEHWREREFLATQESEAMAQDHAQSPVLEQGVEAEEWASFADYVHLGQELRRDLERRRSRGERMLNLTPLSVVPLLTTSEKMLLREVMLPVATNAAAGANVVAEAATVTTATSATLRGASGEEKDQAQNFLVSKGSSSTDEWIQVLPLTYRGAPLLTSLVFKFQLQFFTREQIGFDLRTLCDNLTVLEDLKDNEVASGAGAGQTGQASLTTSSLSLSVGSETSLRAWVQQWTQRAQYVPEAVVGNVPIVSALAAGGQGAMSLSVAAILESYSAEAHSHQQSTASAHAAANASSAAGTSAGAGGGAGFGAGVGSSVAAGMEAGAGAVASGALSLERMPLEHMPLDPCGYLSWLRLPSDKALVELWAQLCHEAESFSQGLAPLYVLPQSERASPSFLPTVQADWAILSNEPQTLQVIDFVLRHTERMQITQPLLPSLEEVMLYALNCKQQELSAVSSGNLAATYQRLLSLLHTQLKREVAWHDASALAAQLRGTWGTSTAGQAYLQLWLQGLELNTMSRRANASGGSGDGSGSNSVGASSGVGSGGGVIDSDKAGAGASAGAWAGAGAGAGVGANSASGQQAHVPALHLWTQQLQILQHKLSLAQAPCASASFKRLSQQFIAAVGLSDPVAEAIASVSGAGAVSAGESSAALPAAWRVLLWVLALPESAVVAQSSESAAGDTSGVVASITQRLQWWRLRLIAPALSSRLSKLLSTALLCTYLSQQLPLLERMIEAYVGQEPALVKRAVALLRHLSHMLIGSLPQWQDLLFKLQRQQRQSEYANVALATLPDLALRSAGEVHPEWTRHAVSISTIEAFQGLESERVLLLLLPKVLANSETDNTMLGDDDVSPELLYSAITRVRSHLRVVHQLPLLTRQLEPLLQQVHDDMMALRDDGQAEQTEQAEQVESTEQVEPTTRDVRAELSAVERANANTKQAAAPVVANEVTVVTSAAATAAPMRSSAAVVETKGDVPENAPELEDAGKNMVVVGLGRIV